MSCRDCDTGCSACVDLSEPCEECGERLFPSEAKIRMDDGLVFCGAECALDEDEAVTP